MTYIITDVDDTVLEFAKCFQEWAEKRGHIANGNVREDGDIGNVFGLDDEPCWALIEQFYADPAFGEITPEPDALAVLPRLHREGFKFVAITACADDARTVELRKKNLRDVFGFDFHAVHCTGLGRSKREFLHAYEPSVWVEDNFGHAVLGAEIGHRAVILDRRYNTHFRDPSVLRVTDWHAIDEHFFKAHTC